MYAHRTNACVCWESYSVIKVNKEEVQIIVSLLLSVKNRNNQRTFKVHWMLFEFICCKYTKIQIFSFQTLSIVIL